MDKDKIKKLQKQSHYNIGGIEVIDVAEAYRLDKDAYLFNVLKYILRAPFKTDAPPEEHLIKARYYLDRKIQNLQKDGNICNQGKDKDATGGVRKKQKGHKGKHRR